MHKEVAECLFAGLLWLIDITAEVPSQSVVALDG